MRRSLALLVALPLTALTAASCGSADVKPNGPSRYELAQQCAARSYATKRKTEGCPSLANIGHRTGDPQAPWDHTPRYHDQRERTEREAALREVLKTRLAGLQFEAYFTDPGYLGGLTIIDPCVAPAAPPITPNALGIDDLTLIEGILRDNADLLGLPPLTNVEMSCDYDNYHYPKDGPPKRPLSECKVLLSPEPIVDPRIVVRRQGAPDSSETERCSPSLQLTSQSLPITADMAPPRTLDIESLLKKHIGEEVTIPGRPGGRFCQPVDPLPGQTASPHCEDIPPTPGQKVTITRESLSVSEVWNVYWDKQASAFRIVRQTTIGLPAGQGETYWEPAEPPKDLTLVTTIYRPSPLTEATPKVAK